ncbi:GMC oxidoreductase, partial [Nocardia sp. NPDC004722]
PAPDTAYLSNDYSRRTHTRFYHAGAPARGGRVHDPMAVLDPELRVKGVRGLRVVDASAMPKLPAVNPNITIMAMGEKCADLIKVAAAP